MRCKSLLLGVVTTMAISSSVFGQEPKRVRVDLNRLPPCVIREGSSKDWSGFEVELLRLILAPRGYQLEFREVPEFDHIFDGLKSGEADVAVAGISVNASREQGLDFSYPTLHSGLGIMVTGERKTGWWYSVRAWFKTTVPSLLCVSGITMVFGHLIWLAERKKNDDFSRRYCQGVLDGMWYVVVAITSVGFSDKMSRSPLGRVLTVLLLIIGLGVAANLVADISAFKIEQRLECSIEHPGDLRGRSIATVRGTTSVDAVHSLGGSPYLVSTLPEALDALEIGKVDAVVFDYPSLRYYERRGGRKRLVMLRQLRDEDYAFALSPKDIKLREALNQGLLELRENGTYELLRQRYEIR